jgi:glycosyltransferase involved in cell wall biosynthesis
VRIVIDVTPLSHPRTGIGNYMLGMLGGLAEATQGRHELVLFAPTGPRNVLRLRDALDPIPGRRCLVITPPPSNMWRKLWSRKQRMPIELLAGKLDVFHFSDWMYPPQRAGLRTTTIHDLLPIHHPEWVDPRTTALHVPKYRNAAETCDLIFANSRFTADDVERTLGFPGERIVVAHPGVHRRFQPQGPRRNFGGPYLFTAATLEPRKNLDTLLATFARLREKRPELRLVIAGPAGWGARVVEAEGVHALGYVDDDALPALYRGAEAFVFPSLFEGFGIPIVEAMASGAPVVVSSHPSMDEASGDAAVRVDPQSPEAIAAGIERAVAEREARVPRGFGHAARFMWRACGEAMLRGYESARGLQRVARRSHA